MKNLLIKYVLLLILVQPFCNINASNLLSLEELAKREMYNVCDNDFIEKKGIFQKGFDKSKVYRLNMINFGDLDSLNIDSIAFHPKDFPNIQEINLPYNRLIPEKIGFFENLQILILSECNKRGKICDISESEAILPDSFWKLKKLRVLIMHEARYSYAPFLSERLSELEELEYLQIHIECIPMAFIALKKLKKVNFLCSYALYHDGIKNENQRSNNYTIEKDFSFLNSLSPVNLNETKNGILNLLYPSDDGKNHIAIEGMVRNGKPDGAWFVFNYKGDTISKRYYREGKEINTWTYRLVSYCDETKYFSLYNFATLDVIFHIDSSISYSLRGKNNSIEQKEYSPSKQLKKYYTIEYAEGMFVADSPNSKATKQTLKLIRTYVPIKNGKMVGAYEEYYDETSNRLRIRATLWYYQHGILASHYTEHFDANGIIYESYEDKYDQYGVPVSYCKEYFDANGIIYKSYEYINDTNGYKNHIYLSIYKKGKLIKYIESYSRNEKDIIIELYNIENEKIIKKD